jgi:hypothetical protein
MNPIVSEAAAVIHDPNASLADKVAAAAKLWSLVEECQKVIEEFKGIARAHAMSVSAGQPKVVINGTGMSQCQVVIPSPSLKLMEGVRIEDEMAALGKFFQTVFDVRLVLKSSNPADFGTLPDPIQTHMASVTTLAHNPPRVSLKVIHGVDEVK